MLTIEGNIVDSQKFFRRRIEIGENGIINKIGEPTGNADFVLKDEIIFPGFIDLHVHARECADHREDYKEDFVSAGQAAINGGVVAFMDMPNNPVPTIDDKSYTDKKKLAEKSEVEVVLCAGIGENSKPLEEYVPYKVFMAPSVGELFFKNFEDLEKTLEKYKGLPVSFHCEDPKILDKENLKPLHELRRPKEAEISAIDFALYLIEKYNIKGKICHCSTREGIEKIKNAKIRKVDVVAEVSPHHLYFDVEMLKEDNRKWMQMNPPLRAHSDRIFLIEALRDGIVDFLATDHAPHTKEEKLKGISGTPQLDTYGPFISWLIKEHKFPLKRIIEICSYNPGNFINQFTKDKYGQIKPGFIGSLSVIDLNKPIKITQNILKTKCGWSPFEGVIFPGRAVMTIIKGKVYMV